MQRAKKFTIRSIILFTWTPETLVTTALIIEGVRGGKMFEGRCYIHVRIRLGSKKNYRGRRRIHDSGAENTICCSSEHVCNIYIIFRVCSFEKIIPKIKKSLYLNIREKTSKNAIIVLLVLLSQLQQTLPTDVCHTRSTDLRRKFWLRSPLEFPS